MKQVEKLDLILRELYQFRYDGKYYSINVIFENLDINVNPIQETRSLANRLKDDRLINCMFYPDGPYAELTTHGVEYCEESSYSYSGSSVVTNNYSISINNSPNSNIINQSANATINQNFNVANEMVEMIRREISTDRSIASGRITEILECLNEIQESAKTRQKPKYAVKSLLSLGSDISSIAGYLSTLAQSVGIL